MTFSLWKIIKKDLWDPLMIRIFNEYSQFAHHPIPLLKNLPNQLWMVQLERESHNSFRNELLLFSFYCSFGLYWARNRKPNWTTFGAWKTHQIRIQSSSNYVESKLRIKCKLIGFYFSFKWFRSRNLSSSSILYVFCAA